MSDVEKRLTAKMVLDDSGYSSTLKGINAELKNNKSELKAATSGLEAFGRTSENIERVQSTFQKQLETQARKVQVYKDSIQKATSTLEKNVSERDKLSRSIEEEKAKLEALERTYGTSNQAFRNTQERLEELQKEFKRVDSSIENNARQIQTYENGLNNAQSELNRTTSASNRFNSELANNNNGLLETSTKLTKFGDKASSVGGALTMGLTVPLAGVAYAAGRVGMDFESNMSRVQAISGATGSDFEKLQNQALDLGAKTSFSANQVAQGMESLASAGFTTTEIMQAVPGTLDAAASSGEDLAMTTDIMTSTLRGFGLEANQAGHVADVLAKNAAETNAAIGDTGEAMKYIAPVAKAMGLSLEEVTAAIGEMSNAGIKGSQAGTTLRTALTRLAKPTDKAAAAMQDLGFNAFDTHGKMLPLNKIISNLQDSTKGLTDEQKQQSIATIFGTESLSGMLALIDAGPQQLNTLTDGLKNSTGAAKEMASVMQNNTKASLEQVMGSLETAGIKMLKSAAPALESVAKVIGDLADKFSNLSPTTQDFIVKAGLIAMVTGPAIGGIGKMATGVGTLIKVGSKLGTAMGLIGTTAEVAITATAGVAVAAEGAGVAAAGAGVATAGLGTTLAGLALPVTAAVAGVAAVGYASYKTAQYLNSSATPAVDLFADKAVYSSQKVTTASGTMAQQVQTGTIKISEATKTAVQSYLDLDKKASSSLMDLQVNSNKFTKETKDTVIKNFTDMSNKSSNLSKEQRDAMTVDFKKLVSDTGTLTTKNKNDVIKQYTAMVNGTKGLTKQQKDQTIKDFTDTLNKSVGITKQQSTDLQKIYTDMGAKIKAGLDKQNADEIKSQTDFFAKSNALSATEEAKALNKTKEYWNNRKKTVDDNQNKITAIIKKASDEHRNITAQEAQEIDKLQQDMKTDAVKALSENEVQSKVILERMKDHSANITAEMAGAKIKELNKLRDDSVKAANDECDKRIAEAIRMRDETKSISSEQADKLIADAKRQKDETVRAAEDTRTQAVNQITSMNSDIANNVNTTTGDTLTKWDKLKNWWANWHPMDKIFNIFTKRHDDGGAVAQNWTGTSHFKGGYTTLHERGEELYELPTGTKIYNHEMSEQMVLETARQTAKSLIDSSLNQQDDDKEITIIVKSYLDNKVIAQSTDKVLMKKRKLEGRLLGGI